MKKAKVKTSMSPGQSLKFFKDNFGEEPTFPLGKELTKMELIHAFNWYSYAMDRSDAIGFMKDYWAKKDPAIRQALNQTDCQYLLTSMCWSARMIDRGFLLGPVIEYKIRDHTKEVIQKYSTERSVISLVDRSKERSDSIIADIEEFLDKKTPFSVYEYLTKATVPKNFITKVSEHYAPILAELKSVPSTKDSQLKEAYRHLTAKATKELIAVYQSILDDCDKFLENKKIVRKPRKAKVVSVEKKIAKVQYLEKFDPFQIVSKPPSAIIGAKEVWLYNAKYKTITKLVSSIGFEIKGTTITNIDMDLSSKKTTGRSSRMVVDKVLKSGKVQLRKLMDEIKGIVSEPTGRINKDVLILRTQ